MTLVSLIYEMSNILCVMREWTVNGKQINSDIDAVIFFKRVTWTVTTLNFIQGVSIYHKLANINKQIPEIFSQIPKSRRRDFYTKDVWKSVLVYFNKVLALLRYFTYQYSSALWS